MEDIKGTATIELVLGAQRSDKSDAPFEAVPAGAKVIVATTDGALLGNGGDKAIVKEESLSGKRMTLKVPVNVNGTEYYLDFTASDPADYSESGEAKKYYYSPSSNYVTMVLFPGAKEVVKVVYEKDVEAEL